MSPKELRFAMLCLWGDTSRISSIFFWSKHLSSHFIDLPPGIGGTRYSKTWFKNYFCQFQGEIMIMQGERQAFLQKQQNLWLFYKCGHFLHILIFVPVVRGGFVMGLEVCVCSFVFWHIVSPFKGIDDVLKHLFFSVSRNDYFLSKISNTREETRQSLLFMLHSAYKTGTGNNLQVIKGLR